MRFRLVLASVMVATAVVALPSGALAVAPKVQFSYTGHEQSYVVPAGVVLLGLAVKGAHGDPHFGGSGGGVGALLQVTPGQRLFVEVGAEGVYGGGVTFGGGGAAGPPPPVLGICTGSPCNTDYANSGGGASDVRTCSMLAASCPGGVSSAATRLVVGGGGGGGGGTGNAPGGLCGATLTGGSANTFQYPPGNPGAPLPIITAAGIVYPGRPTQDGPGTGTVGVTAAGGGSNVAGTGGLDGGCSSGAASVSDSVAGSNAVGPVGGTGGNASSLGPMDPNCSMAIGNCYDAGPGGGGGGGYFGGGGGGTGLDRETGPAPPCPCDNATSGQGGGAGSSFTSNKTIDPVDESPPFGSLEGVAVVVPVVEIDAPANGASYTPGQVVNASWSCGFDGLTGLGIGNGCKGTVANGSRIDTSPGTHTFTVSGIVSSNGPKTASATVTYTVGGKPKAAVGKAKINQAQHTATFTFKATGASGFQCALIKLPNHGKKPRPQFKACTSPKTYKRLKAGRYTFEVRALSAAGTGPPASKGFKIG